MLKVIGVDYAQGFHSDRPIPIQEFFESSEFRIAKPSVRKLLAAAS